MDAEPVEEEEPKPAASPKASGTPPAAGDVPPEVLDGIEIDILADGTVHLHTRCRVGEDPSACQERLQFLVDALGIPMDGVVTEVREA